MTAKDIVAKSGVAVTAAKIKQHTLVSDTRGGTKKNDSKVITIAFAGNPNSGKTTLYNDYTGAHFKTANWPGVTYEVKEATVHYKGRTLRLVDLPGAYALYPGSPEEVEALRFLTGVRSDAENAGEGSTDFSGGAIGADVIINVTDSCTLERSLFFTTQLIGAGTPVVVALNMADLAKKNGIFINTQRLSRMLGAPAVSVSAARRTGLDELLNAAITEAEKARIDGSGNRSSTYKNQKPPVPQGASEVMRYAFISDVISACVTECAPARGSLRRAAASDRADAVLTHTVAGPIIFLAIMAVIFYITFSAGNAIAEFIGRLLDAISVYIAGVLSDAGAADWVLSLVIDGVIAGVGGVLMFLPNILLLFLLLALLEDSGYMARAAYLADGVMVHLGLTGKAFIPIILGLGCSVPAIMATRILDGKQQRLRTILMIPFVACGSRLPVFILISALFFGRYAWLVTFGAFCSGILAAVIVAFIGSRLDVEKSRPGPMIIELPDYKLPSARTVFISVYEKLREYLVRAGTVIFLSAAGLWIFLHIGAEGYSPDMSGSFGAAFCRAAEPFLAPAGLGSWQIAAALIAGIAAKEAVVSAMCVIYGVSGLHTISGMYALREAMTATGFGAANALAFLAFTALYVPCIASLAVIKSETGGWRRVMFAIFVHFITAYTVSSLVYTIALIFM